MILTVSIPRYSLSQDMQGGNKECAFLLREGCTWPGLLQAFSLREVNKEASATIVIPRPPEMAVSSHGRTCFASYVICFVFSSSCE